MARSGNWRLTIASVFLRVKLGIYMPLPELIPPTLESHKLSMLSKGETPAELLSDFRKFCLEAFRDLGDHPMPRFPAPSTSATFNITRAEGGARRILKERFKDEIDENTRRGHRFRLKLFPEEYVSLAKLPHGQRVKMLEDELEGRIERSLLNLYRTQRFVEPDFVQPVKVVPLSEPFKVRVITEGLSHLQALRRVQSLLLQFAKKRFRLLGNSDSLKKIIEDNLDDWRPDRRFVSVDYKSATDNLHMDITRTAVDALIDSVPWISGDMADLLRSESGVHRLFYPDGSEVIQQNGQLMGSLISFPILCLVNEFVIRRGIGRYRSVFINGDDALYEATPWEQKVVETAANSVGLIPSPGKNYSSSWFFTINSRFFRADNILHTRSDGWTVDVVRTIEEVRTVNLSLLDPDQHSRVGVGPLYDEFLNVSKPSSYLAHLFRRVWKDVLVRDPRSLDLPTYLGGLSEMGHYRFYKPHFMDRVMYDHINQGKHLQDFSDRSLLDDLVRATVGKDYVPVYHRHSKVDCPKVCSDLRGLREFWADKFKWFLEPSDLQERAPPNLKEVRNVRKSRHFNVWTQEPVFWTRCYES
jgi:hypothetical protein